ncbi:MAG: HTTM domain-containing protein [Acidobacteriota bacterium]
MTTKPQAADGPLTRLLFRSTDIAGLVFFRIAYGVLMCWDMLGYLAADRIQRFYTGPAVLFTYPGFDWVRPGSQDTMEALFVVLALLALAIAVGLFYRAAAALFFVGFLYVFLLDKATYNNHNYLICLLNFLLIFIPAHRAGSLDAWWRKGLRSKTVAEGWLWILRFQIGVPYFFGGLAKLNYDWMMRAEPMSLWFRYDYAEGPLDLEIFREFWAGYAFAWGGTLFDLAIVPLLVWRRTRLWAFVAATAFHLTNSQLFVIGIFPWLMIAATTIYFDSDWPRRLGLVGKSEVAKPKGRSGKKKTSGRGAAASVDPGQTPGVVVPASTRTLVLVTLGLWVTVQVLLPFRHVLFPGNVDWTEEGNRFAWRMKLRHKEGDVHFVVLDKATQKATVFKDYSGVITRTQQRHMQHDPDMIRQFAVSLAERLAERGQGDVEVRAVTQIALNGRRPAPLVDPEVDLSKVQWRALRADPWVLPLDMEASLPPP